MTLLLGKGVEGVSDTAMEKMSECIVHWIGKWWQRRKDLLYGELMDRFCPLPPPPMKSWIQQIITCS